MTTTTPDDIARELLPLLGTGAQRDGDAGLALAPAYDIARRLADLRRERGERVVGRKIGFTNRTLWEQLGVEGPMWGHVFDTTLTLVPEAGGQCGIAGMPEPRIEPEVVLHLSAAPEPEMDEAALMDCVDWIAGGFEIVQSIYPGWRMSGAEAVAAFGLHGALVVGPKRDVTGDRAGWRAALERFSVELACDGAVADRGVAANVLGGPLSALRALVAEIARHPGSEPLRAGEIVSTGTLTDAHPVAAGQVWRCAFSRIDLPAFPLTLTGEKARVSA